MCAPFSVSVASRASDDFAKVHIRIAFGNRTCLCFRVSRPHRQVRFEKPKHALLVPRGVHGASAVNSVATQRVSPFDHAWVGLSGGVSANFGVSVG